MKKEKEVEIIEEKETKKKALKSEDYFKGVGRRKTSVARVWLKLEKGPIVVNDKPLEEYFAHLNNFKILEEPFKVVNRIGQMSGEIKVNGGGIVSQAGAVLHGISRALLQYDETFRGALSKKKLLTRDPRAKERRKYGMAGKARAKKQSPKR
jgi:small subunit ribosomal protein S9